MAQPVSDFRPFLFAVTQARQAHLSNPSSSKVVRDTRLKCVEIFQNFGYLQLAPQQSENHTRYSAVQQLNGLLRNLETGLEVDIRPYSGRADALAVLGDNLVREDRLVEAPIRERVRQLPPPIQLPFDDSFIPTLGATVVSVIALSTLGYLAMAIAGAVTFFALEWNMEIIRAEFLTGERVVEREVIEATHELFFKEQAPIERAELAPRAGREEIHTCPISQREMAPNDPYLMFHETTGQYFDYREFFLYLICTDRRRAGAMGNLFHFDPLTRQGISLEIFSLVIDRYGIGVLTFRRLWGEEIREKEAQVDAIIAQKARERGLGYASPALREEILLDRSTDVLAKERSVDARVERFFSFMKQQDAYIAQLAPFRNILPSEEMKAMFDRAR